MPWMKPQNRSPVAALTLTALGSAVGEGGVACNWGQYLNIVKLQDDSKRNLADFAFGNEVGDREKGWAGYLSPGQACERGSSHASRLCLKRGCPVPSVPERTATLHKPSRAKAPVLTVVIRSFCVNSGKPCTFLHVFVFPVWICDIPTKYKY